jgi:predicted RNA binding protein YcfA (HicA-like mRNA interferase family)
VNRYAKLILSICNNPKNVRFEDACKVAEELGFKGKGGKGSHNSFSRTGERVGLNFQRCKGGTIPTYQAKQLIEMIEKYGTEPSDSDPQEDGDS